MSELKSLTCTASSNQIVLNDPSFLVATSTLNCPVPASNRIITLADPLGNDTIAYLAATQTFTNKTLTAPTISSISNSGTLTLPTGPDTLVGRATTDTLTNKTLTAPIISTISNTGTLTLPTSTDTLVGRATTDTLSNKTFSTAVTITPTTSQLVLGNTNTTTISAVAPSSSVTLSVQDPGFNCDMMLGSKKVTTITGTTTLTTASSGRVAIVQNSSSAYTITLPSPTSGFNMRFIMGGTALNAAVTIHTPTANIFYGPAIASDATVITNGNPVSSKSSIILGTTSLPGDVVDIYTDGLVYYVDIRIGTHTTITFS